MTSTRSLQEVLFVAHFSAARPLTVLDLANWHEQLEGRYPLFQQQPPWEPYIWHDFHPSAVSRPVIQQLVVHPNFLPRVVGISEDQRWTVHLQSDRVAIGWRRIEPTGEATPYPGFEVTSKEAASFFENFRGWWQVRFGIPAAFRVCELNYFNAFPVNLGERSFRLSEIFKFVSPSPKKKIANLNVSWVFPSDPPKQARVQFLSAVAPTADCPSAAIFNFAAASNVEEQGAPDELNSIFQDLHDLITDAYHITINPEIIGSPL